MSTAFFIFGFLQFLTGYICFVRFSQSQFAFNENDHTNIGKDKTKIVIFFSRLGSTKKLAFEIANEQGAEILEIKTTEKIDGDLGFWWCGRFGMHKWGMPLHMHTCLGLCNICTNKAVLQNVLRKDQQSQLCHHPLYELQVSSHHKRTR